MPGRMAGKNVLITGAATGIGRAAAEMIVAEGGHVVIADINEKAAHDLVARLGPAARFVRCDVTREDEIEALVGEAVAKLGRLDVLVNNAGMIVHKAATEVDIGLWDRVFAVNARSAFLVTKPFNPDMVKALISQALFFNEAVKAAA